MEDYDDCDDYYVKTIQAEYRYYDKWFFRVVVLLYNA
jgi:hypothetical protein